MPREKNPAVVKVLQTLFNVGAVRDLSDGQLLERFATDRGEAAELAFAVLVERHGPMVLRVCRSVLADSADAEDAFQATFLVLVGKARGLWVRDSLGPWLHQVAFGRRRAPDWKPPAAGGTKTRGRGARGDTHREQRRSRRLAPRRDRETARALSRARGSVRLEGCSHQQAARHLGWPVGTVKSRQARGGNDSATACAAAALAPNARVARQRSRFTGPDPVVSPALVEATTRSVVQFVTCQTAVELSTLSLAQGVLKAMAFARWSKVASVLLVLGATVSAAGVAAQGGRLRRRFVPETTPKQPAPTSRSHSGSTPGTLTVTVETGPARIVTQ